ncbi:hypothetical protein [Kitasatospora sp. NPDC050543]|uniref:hypothetical protein n=1 Tax=Kitasatospora sp. NPDC050543 TaxID=3364054 RepID=UPI0037944BDC
MSRLALIAAGVAGATALAVAPAGAVAPSPVSPAGTAATVTICGPSGLQSGLLTKVCADITGNGVQLYGQVGLAGPPTPDSPAPRPRQLITALSGTVAGGVSLGSVNRSVTFLASNVKVDGAGGTVPCGSTVHGSFSVQSYPWPARPVDIDVAVTC